MNTPCSFCGKDRSDGRRMIAVPAATICEECVRRAITIFDEMPACDTAERGDVETECEVQSG